MKSENSFEKIVPKINIICTNSVGVTNFSPKSADSSAIFRPGKSDLITEEARHWCRWMDGRYWLTSGWWLSCLSREPVRKAAGIDRRTNRHRRWRRQKFNKIHEINFNLINRDWVNWLRVEPSRVVFKERERERDWGVVVTGTRWSHSEWKAPRRSSIIQDLSFVLLIEECFINYS